MSQRARRAEARASGWAGRARLHAIEGQRLDAASRAYLAAVEEAPEDARVPRWLERAATLAAEADRPEQATLAWRQLAAQRPEERARAELALGWLWLAEDQPTRALVHFGRAEQEADRPELAEVARQGASVCIDRLGSLDSAVADLGGGSGRERAP